MDQVVEIMKWVAAVSGMIAAFMVSLDNGRRVTGYGFVLFVASSILWIGSGFMSGEEAVAFQNIALFGINVFGVWRYLIRKKAPAGE